MDTCDFNTARVFRRTRGKRLSGVTRTAHFCIGIGILSGIVGATGSGDVTSAKCGYVSQYHGHHMLSYICNNHPNQLLPSTWNPDTAVMYGS